MISENVLEDIVKEYYEKRGLVWPNFDDAMKFALTEMGEVFEIDLARKTWVRNNPEDKPKFNKEDLAKELGDVIMMLIVAGIAEGVNPVQALLEKMNRKSGSHNGISRWNGDGVFIPYSSLPNSGVPTEIIKWAEGEPTTTASENFIDKPSTTVIQSKLEFGSTWD